LAEQMQHFVSFKRLQGYDYTNQARTLSYFDSFLLHECGRVQASCLNLEVLQDYVATTAHLEGYSRHTRLSSLREFSRYLHARDSQSALLPGNIVPRRKPTVRFYRIEPERVADLIAAATTVLPPDSIQAHSIRMLIGLIYCTGLRIREALALTLGNIDALRSTLWREEGKDVNAMLPVLATAMGHVNIFHTQIYLHIEPSELHDAAARLRTRINTHLENK